MLPVVQGIAGLMNGGAGFPPELFYFGLLTGATLGGNLTPIGASANIAAIGILRKQGEQVRTRDFLRIGIPFTLAAVLTGYVYLWLVWGAVSAAVPEQQQRKMRRVKRHSAFLLFIPTRSAGRIPPAAPAPGRGFSRPHGRGRSRDPCR